VPCLERCHVAALGHRGSRTRKRAAAGRGQGGILKFCLALAATKLMATRAPARHVSMQRHTHLRVTDDTANTPQAACIHSLCLQASLLWCKHCKHDTNLPCSTVCTRCLASEQASQRPVLAMALRRALRVNLLHVVCAARCWIIQLFREVPAATGAVPADSARHICSRMAARSRASMTHRKRRHAACVGDGAMLLLILGALAHALTWCMRRCNEPVFAHAMLMVITKCPQAMQTYCHAAELSTLSLRACSNTIQP
jgi:hypothetical protein